MVTFSSYTKGLYQVTAISRGEQCAFVTLYITRELQDKLIKKMNRFIKGSHLSMDGIPAVVHCTQIDIGQKNFLVVTKTSRVFSERLSCCQFVSVGLRSVNPDKWLLEESPSGTVKLDSIEKAEGHEFTLSLTFGCSLEQYKKIKLVQYLGINGSGFFVQSHVADIGKYRFTVYSGKQTREKTIFSIEKMSIGTKCNLSFPTDNSTN